MDKLYYVAFHSTMTDDTHYFSSKDRDALIVSMHIMENFIFNSKDRKYRDVLHDLELNGIKYHSPIFDDEPTGECVKVYEDRF